MDARAAIEDEEREKIQREKNNIHPITQVLYIVLSYYGYIVLCIILLWVYSSK